MGVLVTEGTGSVWTRAYDEAEATKISPPRGDDALYFSLFPPRRYSSTGDCALQARGSGKKRRGFLGDF